MKIPLRLAKNDKSVLLKIVRKIKHLTCKHMFGGHELYVVQNDPTRLFQQCLLCGYETKGWRLDPINRRLHIVKPERRVV